LVAKRSAFSPRSERADILGEITDGHVSGRSGDHDIVCFIGRFGAGARRRSFRRR